MLAAQIEPADDVLVALSVRARDSYEQLAPALRETTGIDIGFWRSGIAAVAFDEAAANRLKEEVARQRQAGLRCDWLDGEEVRERWPGAAPDCQGALLAPEDGALDPQALTRACLADARRLGATLYPEKVEALAITQGRVTGVVTAGGTAPVEHAVLAAGVWSPQIRGLPRPLPVEPLRGQMPPPRGPTTARPRFSITTTATSSRAAATPSSAAPWNGRGTTRGSRTRGSPKFSVAPSDCCRPS